MNDEDEEARLCAGLMDGTICRFSAYVVQGRESWTVGRTWSPYQDGGGEERWRVVRVLSSKLGPPGARHEHFLAERILEG